VLCNHVIEKCGIREFLAKYRHFAMINILKYFIVKPRNANNSFSSPPPPKSDYARNGRDASSRNSEQDFTFNELKFNYCTERAMYCRQPEIMSVISHPRPN